MGQGNNLTLYLPTLISGLSGAKEVAAGDRHSLVLLENGDVYSFGDNSFGQLGHGIRLPIQPSENTRKINAQALKDLEGRPLDQAIRFQIISIVMGAELLTMTGGRFEITEKVTLLNYF